MLRLFALLGKSVITTFSNAGELVLLTLNAFRMIFKKPFYTREFIGQLVHVGYDSLFVTLITAFSTGMVLALQMGVSLEARLTGVTQYVGGIVGLTMVRELGPVLTALVITGRVGSSITAEIGTMKVTEQIDALHTLSTNPTQYLVVPRLLSSIIMLPSLALISDLVGILGGALISNTVLGYSNALYFSNVLTFVGFDDINSGLIKSAFFGLIIAIVCCYQGFKTAGGAEGVGKSTTRAVVISMMAIIITDYVLTSILQVMFSLK
jgi:phospholipid/cholesterol/gamma-HCH transport system permease protein